MLIERLPQLNCEVNMNTAIYQLAIIKHKTAATLARKALSEAEFKALKEKELASREATKMQIIVHCDSAWADEEHPIWGIARFPNLAARIQHTRTIRELGWLDQVEAFTLL